MTLDEAIKHAEEVADICEYEANKYDISDTYERQVGEEEGKCASEHRQLAEWLKDYKRLLEQEPALDKIKAEIERERSYQRMIDEYGIAIGLRKALEIIDKYKESEE